MFISGSYCDWTLHSTLSVHWQIVVKHNMYKSTPGFNRIMVLLLQIDYENMA